MAIKSEITAVLNKKMDRQGFLKHMAIAAVAMSGLGSALKLLAPQAKQRAAKGVGYGDSAYGGSKRVS